MNLVQLGLLLGRLLRDGVEEVLDLVDLGLVALHLALEVLVGHDQLLQGLDVSRQRGLAHLE